VEADRAGYRPGRVERDLHGAALHPARLARREGDRGARLARGSEERQRDEHEEETATHERQGASGRCRLYVPGIRYGTGATKVFDSVTVIGSGRVGSATPPLARRDHRGPGPGPSSSACPTIDRAPRRIPVGPWVARVGRTAQAALEPHRRRLHPLQTFTREHPEQLDGAWGA
jgi:hypothetical protein